MRFLSCPALLTRNGVNVCNGDKECCIWFGIKLFLWFLQKEVDLRFGNIFSYPVC